MEHLTKRDATDRLPQRLQRAFKHLELQAWRDDDDHAYSERRQLLLIMHAAIRSEQHIEMTRSASSQLAIFVSDPTFFLNSPDLEFGKLAPK